MKAAPAPRPAGARGGPFPEGTKLEVLSGAGAPGNIAFIGSSIYLLVVILLVTLPANSRQIDLRVGYLYDSLKLLSLETE